ncbi:conserved hypothetical protein [Histoplasma capsulatum var. duboisii H88]|uniref:Uncharacterized protein n=1 Tax=Ajellomyces capsulatus (strain H88) TaxID=544711 RepID=F0U4R3_AJEC8|nr:conserved hypothetical protein [Histoplasma capsulatum var. duboisii H88]
MSSYKTLLIFFSPLLFRKARSCFHSLRSSLAQRPRPRPLPPGAALALNILFISTCLFLFLSFPAWTGLNPHAPSSNIFALTQSRLNTLTESSLTASPPPPNNTSQPRHQLKANSLPHLRRLYLRYGPETLLACPFCTPDAETTYLLYYLPLHTFLPHLLHLLITGLVTSNPLTGPSASRFRSKFTLTALSLLLLETLLVAFYNPASSPNPAKAHHKTPSTNPQDIPTSFHNNLTTFRLLTFTIFDALAAGTIYLAATHRFFYTPPTPAEVTDQLVAIASATLASATAKVHAVSVVRNATVRDRGLKARDDAYWTAVVAMEGSGLLGTSLGGLGEGGSVWEEEEVVRAMTSVMRRRNAGRKGDVVDVGRLGVEANSYVEGITAGLGRGDDDDDDGDGDGGYDGNSRDGNGSGRNRSRS